MRCHFQVLTHAALSKYVRNVARSPIRQAYLEGHGTICLSLEGCSGGSVIEQGVYTSQVPLAWSACDGRCVNSASALMKRVQLPNKPDRAASPTRLPIPQTGRAKSQISVADSPE